MDATSQIQGATALAPPAAQEAPSTPRAPSSTPDITTSPQIVPFRARSLEDTSARRQTEERLRQAEKMELIGRLTSGVAHDFNNLLTGILLYSDLLLAELSPDSSLHRYVQEVRLACEQGAALTKQLLAVARKQGSETQAIGINEVVARMENLLRHMIGEQIELITALDPAAGTVVADAAQLRQILLNLVLNARDALDCGRVTGGKIRVGTRLSEWPHTVLDDRREPAILLTVEDNGCGMSAEICAHLFEPFFTTKKAGEGTGLGLGTVQRIVGELGGAIEVASAPGSGTRIQIFLPKAQESGESGSPESVPARATVLDGTKGQASAAADTQVLDRIVNTPK